ncbi:cell wall metabolism sensor histidine kinase WalK [Synechococcus sp. Lug-A]|uniref:sensor histidine kinase n=1 Tax=Synechococcus sp. Lug-A TaxID=2823740 RepID=UPI0020CE6A64|nr:HAMP domain-containing sensor histidine kinase [Synechococcus sp. Lug-A]
MRSLLTLAFGMLIGWGLARAAASWRRRSLQARALAVPPLSRSQLLAWLNAAPHGWLALDRASTIQAINTKAEYLLQLPADSLLRGEELSQLVHSPELEEAVQRSRRLERAQRVEWSLGTEPLEATLLPGEDGWMAVWLSSRRSLESQLDQQSRWVSDVAHELKTPLTALLLVGDSLAAQATRSNVVLIERLQRELERLRELVGDLLELSRLENSLPGDDERYRCLDLRDLLAEAWSSLRPLADQRAVSLDLAACPSAPLRGDGSRLHRALLNLLDNALRYTPDGTAIDVEISGTGQWWELTVRDRGCGFSDTDLKHLFERFYRGDPSRVRSRRSGSGLGLAIVQQIALTHGGRVEARNHPAGGALVELVLPRGESPLPSVSP